MYSEEELENRIETWHTDKSILVNLHEYLGWTFSEYAHWVKTNQQPSSTE